MVAAAEGEEEEMEDVYVRRDVWTLDPDAEDSPWNEHLLAYARAVAVMQRRSPEDPTSWARQAALHACRPRGTWFLLPWLRMRLWFFERIVRAIVVADGGPADWALPYWGYADGRPGHSALPGAFAVLALPGGDPNPLYRPDGDRTQGLNAGVPLPDAVTSPARAVAAPTFSPGIGGQPDGPCPHEDPPPPGLLEAQPHDSVIAVLGPDAAPDPVSPLHLATVDRLWEAWLASPPDHANPAQFDWTDEWFAFVDADGRTRSLACGQVGDLANLDYAYAGVPAHARAERVLTAGADAGPLTAGREREIATCTGGCVTLGAEPRRVTLHAAAGDTDAGGGDAPPTRVYLHVEDAEAEAATAGRVWEVRVEGEMTRAPDEGREAAVGTIAFSGPRDGTQRFVFDVTDAIDTLAAGGLRDERALAVTFHPALPAGFVPDPAPAARVGRVFLTQA
jgi:Common central domain of tyrosinase